MDVWIVLNDLLIISGTELWTVHGQNTAIEISNTLKRKTGIPPLTLGAIVIACRTCRPFDMNHIHRSTTAGQSSVLVIFGNAAQLRYVRRHRNELLPHLMHPLKESVKE